MRQGSILMAQQRKQNITGVVKEYSNRLFRFIRSRVPTTADAEDILQETWYQFSNVMDTQPIEQAGAWLFRVARNRITDRYRKKKDERLDDFVFEDDEGGMIFKEILLAEEPSSDMDNLKEVFWEALFEALDELPQNQREVFVWNELEDETFQEIADRTGINIKTLISRKRYAVKHLRQRLLSVYEEFLTY